MTGRGMISQGNARPAGSGPQHAGRSRTLSTSPTTKLGRALRASRQGAVALVLAVAPLVTACGSGGFQPMYAANYNGQSLSDAMAPLFVR